MGEGHVARAQHRKGVPSRAEVSEVAWRSSGELGRRSLSKACVGCSVRGLRSQLLAHSRARQLLEGKAASFLPVLCSESHVGPDAHPTLSPSARVPEARVLKPWPSLHFFLPLGRSVGSCTGQAPSLWSTELQAPQRGRPLCHFARIAKYHRLGGLKIRKLFPRGSSSQRLKGQGQVAGRLGFLRGFSPRLADHQPLAASLRECPLSLHVQISSYKDTSGTGLGPAHMTSFYLNHLLEGPVSKYSPILRSWGLGLQPVNLKGTQSSQ